jgi:hypothetical protein
LIGQADRGERLRLSLDQSGDRWRVSMTRPGRLAVLSDDQLIGSESSFEQGFSLRIVRGLARIAGAELTTPQGSISLLFPRA